MKEKITWKDFYVLIVGMFIVSIAVYYFLMPGKLAIGSMSGFLVVISNFIPLPMSVLTFIANGILLLIGFIFIGREFGAKTVISAILLPVYLRIFEIVTPNVASSALAGYVTAATSILVSDTKTLIVSLIGTYMGGVLLDNFINGFHARKRVCVISKEYQELARYIVYDLNRGATMYEAFGGMSSEKRMEVVSVLEKYEYAKLIQYVHQIDPSAFITVSSVNEVIGNWNDNEKRNRKFR